MTIEQSCNIDENYRTLIVLPTRKSCELLYSKLKNNSELNVDVITTKLTKYDRFLKINKYKHDAKTPIVLITTPLIKAWVDFSFKTWYSDTFNIPDLQQIGWRVNRNWEYWFWQETLSNFYIFQLSDDEIREKVKKWEEICWQRGFDLLDYTLDENDKIFRSKEKSLIRRFQSLEHKISKDFIKKGLIQSEKDWYSNISLFFKEIDNQRIQKGINIKMWETLLIKLNLKKYVDLFKLINNEEDLDWNKINIFINNNFYSNEIKNYLESHTCNWLLHKKELEYSIKGENNFNYDYRSFICPIDKEIFWDEQETVVEETTARNKLDIKIIKRNIWYFFINNFVIYIEHYKQLDLFSRKLFNNI